MTTTISQQFHAVDFSELEKQFGNEDDKCQFSGCAISPTTHYALCPEDGCVSRESLCTIHANAVRTAPFGFVFQFDQCKHSVDSHLITITPK